MTKFKYIDPAVIQAAAARGDHWYPHAEQQPIPENYTQPVISPRGYMLHTMAGPRSTDPESLVKYMARSDINGECHQVLGYTKCIQVVAFNVRADNNYKANSWWENGTLYGFVSVETQDDGANNNVEDDPWNPFQIEHLAGTAAFLHLRYGIPLDRCTSWTDGGVDGHRAFPEWSKWVGKTCPGQTRWEQIPFVIALAQQIVDWRPAPVDPPEVEPEEDDMKAVRLRFRIGGKLYDDQVVATTLANPEHVRKAGLDKAPLFVADVDAPVSAVESELGFRLTPST